MSAANVVKGNWRAVPSSLLGNQSGDVFLSVAAECHVWFSLLRLITSCLFKVTWSIKMNMQIGRSDSTMLK